MLSDDPERHAERSLTAAAAKHLAGSPDAAGRLLADASAGPLNELAAARVELLRAEIAFSRNRGGDAALKLLRAARRLELHSMHRWPARHFWLRCRQCDLPTRWAGVSALGMSPGQHSRRRSRRDRGPAMSCSMRWRPQRSMGTWPLCRR